MRSTMQDVQLQIRRILEHGRTFHSEARVVTATGNGLEEATYAEVGANAARLAHGLRELGVRPGDRVATFMWNNRRHLEAYLAVPAMGAVLHPLNIRLAADQISYIADHAQDKVVIVDESLLGVLPELKTVEHIVVTDLNGHHFDGLPVAIHDYGRLIEGRPDTYPWPDVDERRAAAMCYTSGTTGDPKGVVYSHRSIYLHSLGSALRDYFDLAEADRVLAVVPQFHVLAWGLPYTAFMTGASLAMPDRFLAAEPLAAFIAAAGPNKAAGVPTVWQSLLDHLDAHPAADISSLREIVVGGSACPPSLMQAYQETYGVNVLHAWGMTEMSPLGTMARPPAGADAEQARRYQLTQGRFPVAVEPRLVGTDGEILPHDGRSIGELEVRGPWITGGYHGAEPFPDSWLRTGDIGSITADGFLTLTDRAKDVIKSGGEWISSVELENRLIAHPSVREAAVIGVPDDRWGERPLAIVVAPHGEESSTIAELHAFLAAQVPKWQLPERWAFVTEIPKNSVGKFDKKALRHWHTEGRIEVRLHEGTQYVS